MSTTKAITRTIIRKAVNSIITLLLVIILNFVLFRLMPGNPVNAMVPPDPKIPAEYKEHLIEEYGLNDPMYVQFFTYIKDTFLLRFGDSFADPGSSAMSIVLDNLAIALRPRLEARERRVIAAWLRPLEAFVRRIVLIEAAALALHSAPPPGPRVAAPGARTRRQAGAAQRAL